MRRRDFIALLGGAAALPLAVRAQQPAMLPTIGFLGSGTPAAHGHWVAAFVQRLRELGRQRRQSISSAFGPAVIDADIAMLDIASLAQAAPERRNEVRELAGRFQAEKPDHRHRRLLRARHERPRRRCAPEQRDELAPPHGLTPMLRITNQV